MQGGNCACQQALGGQQAELVAEIVKTLISKKKKPTVLDFIGNLMQNTIKLHWNICVLSEVMAN